jgi:uncharacterized protein involved in exopolysaccharide biosynthesis
MTDSDDELRLQDVVAGGRRAVSLLRRRHRRMYFPMVLAIACGVLAGVFITPQYSAVMRLMPYRIGGDASSVLGLSALNGLRLAVGDAPGTVGDALYPDVVASLDYRLELARVPLRFGVADSTRSFAAWMGVLTLPESTSRDVVLDATLRALTRGLAERVQVSVDRKTRVLTLTATMPDPYAAADLARAGAQQLQQRVSALETRRAEAQLRFVESQLREARERHRRAQGALRAFRERNRLLMSAGAQLGADRLARDVELAFESFSQLTREETQARIRVAQDTPSFGVLEQAAVPLAPSTPNWVVIAAVSLMAGFGLGVVRVIWPEVGAPPA